jgi:hypothetical protein
MMKRLRIKASFLALFFGLGVSQVEASDLVLGGHFGWADASDLIYGVNLTAHPYEMYGLRMDLTLGDGFISSNPAFIVYPVAYEEMSFGLFGGPGITKFSDSPAKFGLNFGALGTIKVGPAIEAGIDARYVFPIEGDGGFMLSATLGFVFSMGDSW